MASSSLHAHLQVYKIERSGWWTEVTRTSQLLLMQGIRPANQLKPGELIHFSIGFHREQVVKVGFLNVVNSIMFKVGILLF